MNRYKCIVTDVQATAAAAAHPDGAYVKWTDHVAEVERLKARLAEAVAVLKQVDGCRDGLCDKCQDALDSILDAARADGAGEDTRTCKSCGFVAKSDGWLNCPRCTAAATPPAEVK
jgi:hypothetical protein